MEASITTNGLPTVASVNPATSSPAVPFEQYWCANFDETTKVDESIGPWLYGINARYKDYCLSLEKPIPLPPLLLGGAAQPSCDHPTGRPPSRNHAVALFATSSLRPYSFMFGLLGAIFQYHYYSWIRDPTLTHQIPILLPPCI